MNEPGQPDGVVPRSGLEGPAPSPAKTGADARSFLRAMRERYACKKFAAEKPLGASMVEYILECGRLSPSSFGLEPWHFVAASSAAAIRDLCAACLSQEAVGSAPLVVVILVRRERDYDPDSAFVVGRSERFPGGHPVFRADYEGYWRELRDGGRLPCWAKSQSYIACANMMTGAAAAGLDSCAIEGYKEEEVLAAIGKSGSEWAVGIVASFGYRGEEPRPKIRMDIGDVSEPL